MNPRLPAYQTGALTRLNYSPEMTTTSAFSLPSVGQHNAWIRVLSLPCTPLAPLPQDSNLDLQGSEPCVLPIRPESEVAFRASFENRTRTSSLPRRCASVSTKEAMGPVTGIEPASCCLQGSRTSQRVLHRQVPLLGLHLFTGWGDSTKCPSRCSHVSQRGWGTNESATSDSNRHDQFGRLGC